VRQEQETTTEPRRIARQTDLVNQGPRRLLSRPIMETLLRFARMFRVGLLVLLSLAGLWALAESPRAGGQHVVLRNGRVLSGTVTSLGDRTVIRFPQGGEVTLPSKEILITCHELTEAYRELAERIADRRTATPNIELARWCLRNDLLAEAAEQLALARQRDGKHASLDPLQRQLDRLQQLAETPPEPARHIASTPLQATPSSFSSSVPAAKRNAQPARPPTMEELEETMRSIPKEGVEMFVNTIQPLMWNKCGTNRCHDTGGPSDLRVLRPVTNNQVWRRLSLRNLYTVLEYVDRHDPDGSPLVVKSREPHGGLAAAPLSEESLPYQQILVWARGVSGRRSPQPVDSVASREARAENVTAAGLQDASRVAPASFESPVVSERTPQTPRGDQDPAQAADHGPAEAANYVPRDPFDPEVFNRKYLRK
jgi:hypothetical protein